MSGLNKEQHEAMVYNEGPLLILAGAGSGKTRVLTEKIVYLVENNLVLPENILAITFTNKAAQEMRHRIKSRLGHTGYMQISTFHALGLKIIREYHQLLKLNKNFTIIDSDDVLTVIKKILKSMNLDPKHYSPYYIKEQISNAKNNLINAVTYNNLAKMGIDQVVGKVYLEYEALLNKNHSLDFDDLLQLSYKLLKTNSEVLNYYQDKFKYILVDEYQDTNMVQYEMVKILSDKHKHLCVVGDSDQSIYSWRGANYQNILNFEKDFKDAKVILLEQNYRSTEMILKSANSLIKHNQNRKDKNLWSSLGKGEPIQYYQLDNEIEEANQIIKIIKEINQPLSEICVLYRTNAQSRIIEEALLKANIPYKIVGGFQFYNRSEIKDLIAYLKLINNTYDDISLLRVINKPKRGIGSKSIENLEMLAKEQNISLFEAINDKKLLQFKDIIIKLQTLANEKTLTELVEEILELTKLKEQYSNGTLEENIRLENLEEFKSITTSFEEEYGSTTLADFLNEISLLTDFENKTLDKDAVTLMTMHAAKGLEFNYVIITGLEESVFPHLKSLDNAEAIEEERRLCYVAITRAKKKCYLLSAKKRMLFGQTKSNLTSRFLKEIDNNLIEKHELATGFLKELTIKKPKLTDNRHGYKIGDNVQHKIYGNGVIVELKGYIATIVFGKEIKKILVTHTFLKKR